MLVQENFLKKLRSAFDLNIYEAKIWTALLSRGVATAGELSDISNVPRSRSYDVLESLEKKGFVMMKLGKPIKYIALKPDEILKRVKDNVSKESQKRLKNLELVREEKIFKDLELLFKTGIEHIDPTSLSSSIKGRENIYSHLNTLFQNAKQSITIITTPKGFMRKVPTFKSKFKKLANKGVKVKIVTQPSEQLSSYIKDLTGIATVQLVKNINARMVIIDDQEVVFMLIDDNKLHESNDTAVWVKTPYFAKAMIEMINNTSLKR